MATFIENREVELSDLRGKPKTYSSQKPSQPPSHPKRKKEYHSKPQKSEAVELSIECSESSQQLYKEALLKLSQIKDFRDADKICHFLLALNPLKTEIFRHLYEQGFNNPKNPITQKQINQYFDKLHAIFNTTNETENLILMKLFRQFLPIARLLLDQRYITLPLNDDTQLNQYLNSIKIQRKISLTWMLSNFLPELNVEQGFNPVFKDKITTAQARIPTRKIGPEVAALVMNRIKNKIVTPIPEIEDMPILFPENYENRLKAIERKLERQYENAFFLWSQYRIKAKRTVIITLLQDIKTCQTLNALNTIILCRLLENAVNTQEVSRHCNPLSFLAQRYGLFTEPARTQKTLENMLMSLRRAA